MSYLDIKASIINEAGRIGVDVIGFTSCAPFTEVEEVLKDRESKGYLSGFEEREFKKRTNPRLIMEDCKTIISAGISYNIDLVNVKQKMDLRYKCIFSRTTWGDDYHNVLKPKLQEISTFIKANFNGSTKAFVDIGPLVEREIARRAGVGFIGKNCSVINPEFGSYIFIGEILTNIYIEPDFPIEDDCGDCDICIRACPSGALCSPYTLNAKKCISYITQDKNLSFESSSKFKNNIYGCDVCQNVCPRNRGAKISNHSEFLPGEWNSFPDVMDILNMDNNMYKDTFKKTSSGWRGRSVLQRNAIIALGNSGDRDAAVHIKKMLFDERPEIRKASIFALYNLLGIGSSPILEEHFTRETNDEISFIITDLLHKI